MSDLLRSKISGVRRKRALVAGGTGLTAALCAAVLLLAAGMVLDWRLDLPRDWRLALLIADGVVVLALLAWLVLVPVVRSPDDEEVALAVEEAEPSFGSRLIAAVQFARPGAVPAGASVALVRAMVAQTERMAGPADFNRVVDTRRLRRLTLTAALVVVLCAAAYAWGGNVSRDLLRRAMLENVPVPRDTRVQVLGPERRVVAIGDGVTLTARAVGVVPDRGTLRVVMASGRTQSLPMEPAQGAAAAPNPTPAPATAPMTALASRPADAARPDTFSCTIENVQESFTWTVRLNDGRSERPFRVDAVPRPAAAKVVCEQVYPAYTGRGPEPRNLGDLTLLTGSRLRIAVTPNKPVRGTPAPDGSRNVVHLVGSDLDVPLRPRTRRVTEPGGPDRDVQDQFVETDLPPGTTGFSVYLVDEYGLRSRDPAVYPIAMVPDKPPRPRVTEPKSRESLVVRQQKQWVRYEVADDFGVANVVLRFKVDEGETQTIPLPPANGAAFVRGEYLWDLDTVRTTGAGTVGAVPGEAAGAARPAAAPATGPASALPVLEGNAIEFWLEAEDANTVSGPGRGVGDHYTLRVVSEADWKAAIWGRVGESIQSIKRTTEAQEKLAGSTGGLLTERRPAPASQPATAPTRPER